MSIIDNIDRDIIENDGRLLPDLWSLQSRLRTAFKPVHRRWRQNMALYLGHHFRDSTVDPLKDILNQTRKRRLMWNISNTLVNKVSSRLSKNKPNLAVVPLEGDLEDENDAKIGQLVYDYHQRRIDYAEINRQSIWNMAIFGLSVEYLFWDDFAEYDGKDWLGEPEVEVVSPFELLWDPTISQEDELRWMMRTKVMKVGFLKHLFPQHKDKIKPNNEFTILNSMTNENFHPTDDVVVMEMFLKPVPEYPEGLHLMATKDLILKKSDWLYEKYFRLPFYFTHYEKIENNLFGNTPLTQIRPLQIETNKIVSHMSENLNLAGRPKILAPRNANLLDRAFTNGITIIQYDGPTAPIYINPGSISGESFTFLDITVQKMSDAFGLGPVSTGNIPSNAGSGISLQFLDEKETESLAPIQQRIDMKNAKLWQGLTDLVHEKYDPKDERILDILGEDNEFRRKSWDTQIEKKYHIVYLPISDFSNSFAGRLQQLLQIKEISPEGVTQDDLSDILGLKNFGRKNNELTIDRITARMENQTILESPIDSVESNVDARDYENHIIHLKEHNLELKRLKLKGVQANDHRMQKFLTHIEKHEAFLGQENSVSNITGSQVSPQLGADVGTTAPGQVAPGAGTVALPA